MQSNSLDKAGRLASQVPLGKPSSSRARFRLSPEPSGSGRGCSRGTGGQEGEAELLLRMIERRFGPLSAADRARIQRADADA
jgi:hypothetical protein